MSQQLINHSPDLRQLRDEGYNVEIRSSYLLIKDVPYVNSQKEIKYGTLVSELTLHGDVTAPPHTHVALFAGEHPCYKDGTEIHQIKHQSTDQDLGGFTINHSFSSKPSSGGYKDFYEKMSTYVAIVTSQAQAIDPSVTAKTFPAIGVTEGESVFKFHDTASSRAGITATTAKLELAKIGIVGLGGTGSYILDLIAKTPVNEIHIFDGDKFSNHNAFRSPGAPSLDDLRLGSQKVHYFTEIYSKMHRNIIPHDIFIDASTIDQLKDMNFVFLSLDGGPGKRVIIESLEEWGISFIDVGMGLHLVDGSILGILRVTTSTEVQRRHVGEKHRISMTQDVVNDDYAQNIQVADLNSLNAALAVIKWKKLYGFYYDLDQEYHSTYTVDGNMLVNDDKL